MTTLLLLSVAHASSGYPASLESELGMPCAPQCTVCHTTNGGGGGTVTAEFGMAMMDRGLTGGTQTDKLISALDAMTADLVDSDADGTPDTEELMGGDDPNGGDPFCAMATPEYGCFNQARAPMGVFGLLVAVAGLRRRRT